MKNIYLFVVVILILSSCHKNGNITPPPPNEEDTTLYKVTTIADLPGTATGLAIDSAGNIFCTCKSAIYKITGSTVTLYAGSPTDTGYINGDRLSAKFVDPVGVTIDKNGNLYVIDALNWVGYEVIRKIDVKGMVSTVVYTPNLYHEYDEYNDTLLARNDTSGLLYQINDAQVVGNQLFIYTLHNNRYLGYAYMPIQNNLAICNIDDSFRMVKSFEFDTYNTARGFRVSQDNNYVYLSNAYGIYSLNMLTGSINPTNIYDNNFVDFELGEGDTVIYKPRIDYCTIDRMSIATGQTSTIAGQKDTLPLYISHLSKDGVGLDASFNHICYIKKKGKYLYISETDEGVGTSFKIRKMRIP
ncbi:hypothetical protein A9P82_05875 [Arachidicoccus ginsenosidimutans]|uniref:hypothetical protein n=1 Tax=Arachidicoccus sp. BS20 TaxID=1850526 RepID=UPI0007F0C810|nr:hypothetical protein [Arachidicoccus sp. BS20]ANI88859.1 hypothetical protein A9P82_05875 [Arachidicoccus sp. BS20]